MKYSKTRQELLQSTVDFYNSTNRGTNKMGNCVYITDDGKRCAIGREVNKNTAQKLQDKNDYLESETMLDLLPKRLLDLGKVFLRNIQSIHDNQLNWGKDGLSEHGKEEVKRLAVKCNVKITL